MMKAMAVIGNEKKENGITKEICRYAWNGLEG